VGLFLPSPVDVAKRATQPNPYAPSLPTQFSVALGQLSSRGIRGGLSGLTGSEADYDLEQLRGDAAIGAYLPSVRNDDVPIPPSRLTPRLPDGVMGHGTGPQTGAYNKGWVNLRSDPARGWGGLSRTIHANQHAINGTLLDPRTRAPLPRDAQAAFEATNPDELRLEDVYGSNS
jgi:hypothetical protein